jgi:methyltransferase (TIGR00027 family)
MELWLSSQGDLLRQVMGDFFAIRTRFYDRFLMAAVEAGCRQVAILAAGLDTRPFRLDWPAPVRVFELDRADVFGFKDGVLAGREPAGASERVAVVADLRHDWSSALFGHGFDPRVPTAWLVEGLVVYLTAAEIDAMLDRIGELSAPGSRLGLEYGSRAMLHSDQTRTALENDDTEGGALAVLAGLWRNESTEDPVAMLARHGWSASGMEIAAAAAEYGRETPLAFDPDIPGTARIGLFTAKRASPQP